MPKDTGDVADVKSAPANAPTGKTPVALSASPTLASSDGYSKPERPV